MNSFERWATDHPDKTIEYYSYSAALKALESNPPHVFYWREENGERFPDWRDEIDYESYNQQRDYYLQKLETYDVTTYFISPEYRHFAGDKFEHKLHDIFHVWSLLQFRLASLCKRFAMTHIDKDGDCVHFWYPHVEDEFFKTFPAARSMFEKANLHEGCNTHVDWALRWISFIEIHWDDLMLFDCGHEYCK